MKHKQSTLLLFITVFGLGALAGKWLFAPPQQKVVQVISDQSAIKQDKLWLNEPSEKHQEIVRLSAENKVYRQQLALLNQKLQQASKNTLSSIQQFKKNEVSFMSSRSPLFSDAQIADRIKSSLAMQLTPITNELKHVLDLSPQQHKELAQLLRQKAEADIDASAAMFTRPQQRYAEHPSAISSSVPTDGDDVMATSFGVIDGFAKLEVFDAPIDPIERDPAINDRLDENQIYYEKQIAMLLSAEQMDSYQTLEQDKHNKQVMMGIRMQARIMTHRINTLDEYQQQEIGRLIDDYQEQQLSQTDIKIGTYGNPFAQRFTTDPQLHLRLRQDLDLILTPEQRQSYQQSQRHMMQPFIGQFDSK
jgi:hypothetical protein